MKGPERQKMCSNCDGRIPYEATQCPYCFAALPVDPLVQGSLFKSSSTNESLGALYTPPYTAKPAETEEKKPFFKQSEPSKLSSPKIDPNNKGFLPILLLTLGGNLLALGLLQLFFSEQGVVKLEVNASYWFLFILVSIPLFYFGLGQVDES
jgi:hypothetical protein